MAKAYKCDFCEKYREGKPKMKMLIRHTKEDRVFYEKIAGICESCYESDLSLMMMKGFEEGD